MCASYTLNKDGVKIPLGGKTRVFPTAKREKIRPTDPAPIISGTVEGAACRELRWGWQVPWNQGPLINAKSETLTTLATFRPHLEQRCLLLADGFYENGALFRQPAGEVFCLAGLWRDEAAGTRFVMLTTQPNATVAPHHDRMPLIVRPALYDAWLGADWQRVLAEPDHAPLEKYQSQPELF